MNNGIYFRYEEMNKNRKIWNKKNPDKKITKLALNSIVGDYCPCCGYDAKMVLDYDVPIYDCFDVVYIIDFGDIKRGYIIGWFKYFIDLWDYPNYPAEAPIHYAVALDEDDNTWALDWFGHEEKDIYNTKEEAEKALKEQNK